MKQCLLKTASVTAIAAFLFAMTQSCVKEEFDLERIDTTVSFGGEALVFPLGSTEQLILKTLLPEEDFEFITSMDGVYGFRMSEEMDFSEDIPDISADMDIDAVEISEDLEVNFDDISDASDMKIEQQTFESNIDFNGVDVPEIDIPENTYDNLVSTGIWEYTPDPEELSLDFEDQSLDFSGVYGSDDLESLLDKAGTSGIIYVSSLPAKNLPEKNFSVDVKVVLPDGISDVRDIRLDENARIKIDMEVVNPFMERGSVIPDISLNLSELLSIEGNTSILNIGNGFELNNYNGYKASEAYRIESLAVDENDWSDTEEGYTLSKHSEVSAYGSVSFENIRTSVETVEESSRNGGLGLLINISFDNVVIDDMTLTVSEVGDGNSGVESDFDLEIDPIKLPEQVKGVEEVRFMPGSGIDLEISGEKLSEMTGINAELENVVITFPESIVSDDLGYGNTLEIPVVDLKSTTTRHIEVSAIIPGEPDSNLEITVDGKVTVTADMSLGGTVSLSSLPASEQDDPKVNFRVTTNLQIADYTLVMDRIDHSIENQKKEFEIDMPEGVGEVGTLTITPEGNPQLTVDVIMPELQDMTMEAKTLKLSFPDMIKFRDVPQEYGYQESDNSINFENEEIPEHIVLDIETLVLTPRKNAETGKYFASGVLTYSGEASLLPSMDGTVISTDVEKLIDEGIQVQANIPEINVAEVAFTKFETTVEQSRTLDLFDFADLPEQLVRLDEVLLDQAVLNMSLNAGDLPDMGETASAPMIDLNVYLPVEVMVDDTGLENVEFEEYDETFNLLRISGAMDSENQFSMEPVTIKGFDMSNVDLSQGGKFSKEIKVEGKVYVDNPEISPEELNGESVTVNLVCSIKSPAPEGDPGQAGDKIRISRIVGVVDYKLGEDGSTDMNQTISLDDLPDFVKDENFTLDFENPYIQVDVTSNVGIPVHGTIDITPYYDGAAGTVEHITLDIPAAEDASQVETTTYWLASSNEGMPSGYTWVDADIRGMLKRIPEKIDLKIDAGTSADEVSVIDPSADYQLKLSYDVVVPFVFGEDLNIEMEYTIPGDGFSSDSDSDSDSDGSQTGEELSLPPVLGELLGMNALGLGGHVESSLPLKLELIMELLDSKGDIIETEEPVTTVIAAGSEEKPVQSPIDLKLKLAEGEDATDLSKIRMRFAVKSGNMSGEPVTEKSYIQAVLKVKVPGGITVDLSSLGESENSGDPDYTGTENW